MVAAVAVAAVIMYMYWNRDKEVITHGVLVAKEVRIEV